MEETEEIEVMPDVDLSSDSEEENEDEVSLIVLKRPELKKRQVEEIEVQKLVKSILIYKMNY